MSRVSVGRRLSRRRVPNVGKEEEGAMNYVSRSPSGVFDLTKYEDYLERERHQLAARIHGADLLAIERFVPTGPGSFHDSRFERLILATGAAESVGSAPQKLRVELQLKGPYFDRYFELRYEDVASCIVQAPVPEDDLLMHEVRSERGILTHELLFERGKIVVISCREMHFIERLEDDGVGSGQ
jgi:hypothetical protein